MEIRKWIDFGENLINASNPNYFPPSWNEVPSIDEKFVDYVSFYKEENKIQNLEKYDPWNSKLEKMTGFFDVSRGIINNLGETFRAKSVYLKDGFIRYLQNEELENEVKEEQVFFNENGFVYKIFKNQIDTYYEELEKEEYDDEDEDEISSFEDEVEASIEDENTQIYNDGGENFILNLGMSGFFLDDVYRVIKTNVNESYFLEFKQFTSDNARLLLNKRNYGGGIIDLILNVDSSVDYGYALNRIKMEPEILSDHKKLCSLVGDLEITNPIYPERGFLTFKEATSFLLK